MKHLPFTPFEIDQRPTSYEANEDDIYLPSEGLLSFLRCFFLFFLGEEATDRGHCTTHFGSCLFVCCWVADLAFSKMLDQLVDLAAATASRVERIRFPTTKTELLIV